MPTMLRFPRVLKYRSISLPVHRRIIYYPKMEHSCRVVMVKDAHGVPTCSNMIMVRI